jgi:hypothetical protein
MSNQRLYLFSSNATDLYLQDAINTLSQPPGSIVHYRYEETYVDPALVNTVQTADLLNSAVLLSLFDHRFLAVAALTALTSAQVIFPLRHGTLIGFEHVDSVLHFWVRLGEYVQIQTLPGYGRLVADVVSRLGLLLPTKTPGRFAALGDGAALVEEVPGLGIRMIVEAITQDCLDPARLAFLQVGGVQRIERGILVNEPQDRTSQSLAKGLPALSRALWKPATTYVIGVSWYAPAAPPVGSDGHSLVLSIEHDDTQLVVAGPSTIRMTGRYDKEYVYVTPRVPNKSVQTSVTLRVVQQDGQVPPSIPKNLTVLGLSYTLPVLIDAGEGRYTRMTAWSDAGVAAGVFLVVLAGLLVKPAVPGTATTAAAQPWLTTDFHWLLLLAGLLTLLASIGKAYAASRL